MLDKNKLNQLLNELKTGLTKVYGQKLKGLYLYGSYARGEQTVDSDLDVLVILDDFQRPWPEINRTGQLSSNLSLKYDISLSKVFMREKQWANGESPFLYNVRDEAIAA